MGLKTEEETEEETEEAIVHRGTFVVGDGEHVGPGGKVVLAKSEVARFRATGHLKGPNGEVQNTGIGPVYDTTNGQPSVSEAN